MTDLYNPIIKTDAYERKADLGGGYRGICFDCRTKTKHESPVLETLDKAGFWALSKAAELYADITVTAGHYKGQRYRKNYFLVS